MGWQQSTGVTSKMSQSLLFLDCSEISGLCGSRSGQQHHLNAAFIMIEYVSFKKDFNSV